LEERMKKKFFSLLFPDNDLSGLIEVREIFSSAQYTRKRFFKDVKELIAYSIPTNCNIFFGLYRRGYRKKKNLIDGSKDNCLHTRVIYLDFDHVELKEIKLRFRRNEIPYPTAIVNSGNGFHCYWVLKIDVFDITNLLRAMQKATGADSKAVDKARIFRLPGSYNVKDPNNKKKCDIIELNNNQYDVQVFLDMFNVEIELNKRREFRNKIDLSTLRINRNCILEILKGVPEGFRHFSLGRLTKYFQQCGYKQIDVRQTVLDWNQNCNPPLDDTDLLSSFYKYWTTDYKLLGCMIPDTTLQAKLSRFCNRKKCRFPIKDCKFNLSHSFGLNNLLFNDFRKKTGQQIIIYGLLIRHPEGLTSSQLEEKLVGKATGKPCIGRDSRRKALTSLKGNGFIEIINQNRKAGKENFYRIVKRGNFGRGFTVLTNGAINGAIDGRITPLLLKVYVLLCKFGWSELATPSLETLSKELGIPRSGISDHLKALEEADYIKRYYEENSKGANKLICRLLL
jgi:hypothetical protein